MWVSISSLPHDLLTIPIIEKARAYQGDQESGSGHYPGKLGWEKQPDETLDGVLDIGTR
jgi:hypothetical protein